MKALFQTINEMGGSVAISRHPRAKNLRITIKQDKTVRVTIPRGYALDDVREFLKTKLDWVEENINRMHQLEKEQGSDRLSNYSQEQINEMAYGIVDRLNELADRYGFQYRQVRIKLQKTKWGSCSYQNNLNLNLNIAFLPDHLRDYILLHELVHLHIKNHSQKFWDELDLYLDGKARQLSKELKGIRMRLY